MRYLGSMARGFWHQRHEQTGSSPARPANTSVTLESRHPHVTRVTMERGKSKLPSKQRHDRERSIKRDRIFQERRQERLRLWGYVLLKNGEVLSIDDAVTRLRDGIRSKENPNITGGIEKDEILEWHQPESVRDVLDSKGEIDVAKGVYYPALGLGEGTVLIDPKIRHRDRALCWR